MSLHPAGERPGRGTPGPGRHLRHLRPRRPGPPERQAAGHPALTPKSHTHVTLMPLPGADPATPVAGHRDLGGLPKRLLG